MDPPKAAIGEVRTRNLTASPQDPIWLSLKMEPSAHLDCRVLSNLILWYEKNRVWADSRRESPGLGELAVKTAGRRQARHLSRSHDRFDKI